MCVLAIYLMGNRLASSGVSKHRQRRGGGGGGEGGGGDSRKLVITLQELLHHGLEMVVLEMVVIHPVEGNIRTLLQQ